MHAESKSKALKRLKIIEGQVRGLQKMVLEEKYCMDIIDQADAVKKALGGVQHVLLGNHLSTHVVEQMRNGQSKKAVDEILSLHKFINR